jgi:lipopolysaccharide/colanic/teichoic acid biosynthesis glycosyltransferase
MHKKGIYEKYIKRSFDLIVAVIAFIVLFPLLIIIAVLIRIKLGSPIIFKQKRPGLNEKIFTLYKFRTMTDKKDDQGVLLPDRERLTKFGKFLRSTSIDELPGLINIIKGDMSIVGPRPLLVEYLELYNSEQRKRHEVRPGLSGYAQINGRNALSWEDKFKLDVVYAYNVTFLHDIGIILKTIVKVVKREGISSANSITMEKFNGNSN